MKEQCNHLYATHAEVTKISFLEVGNTLSHKVLRTESIPAAIYPAASFYRCGNQSLEQLNLPKAVLLKE